MQVGQAKIAISDQYLASSRAVNAATVRCYQHGAAEPWLVVTLTAGSKRRSLLMAGDDDEMSQRYAEDSRTEFNCISGKSVAYVGCVAQLV